ncbi:MAG: methylated-DNA--[protein]-cysteine S-methyltransferase [Legionellaceae bacterium]|nr:methylated-DNA--[protein]-cysteine S-methyltransferase [Legionellaceae bacterium]
MNAKSKTQATASCFTSTKNLTDHAVRAIFAHIIPAGANIPQQSLFNAHSFDSPLGAMLAIADQNALYLLEFMDKPLLPATLQKFAKKHKAILVAGESPPIKHIQRELAKYFTGQLLTFHTPIHLSGSDFQRSVWQELRAIPYGETRSYAQQAQRLHKASAFRAVANANGANPLAIIVPCHRVICSNGALGGYSGGIDRKQWLITHERSAPQTEPL